MRKYLFDIAVFVSCIALLVMFGWHLTSGPRSFANEKILAAKSEKVKNERDDMRNRRLKFENRVNLLRPENIDPDLIEELARTQLGFAHADDIVVEWAD